MAPVVHIVLFEFKPDTPKDVVASVGLGLSNPLPSTQADGVCGSYVTRWWG